MSYEYPEEKKRVVYSIDVTDVVLMYLGRVRDGIHEDIKQEALQKISCHVSDATGIYDDVANIVVGYLGLGSWYMLETWMRDPLFWFIITKVLPASYGFMKHKSMEHNSVIGGYRGKKLLRTFKLVLSVVKYSHTFLYNRRNGSRLRFLTQQMRVEVLDILSNMSCNDIYYFVCAHMNEEYDPLFRTISLDDIMKFYGVISNYPPDVTELPLYLPPYVISLFAQTSINLGIKITNPDKI